MIDAYMHISLYYNILLGVVIIVSLSLLFFPNYNENSYLGNKWKLFLLFMFTLYFIGIREWWVEDVFVDSIRYGNNYLKMDSSDVLWESKDIGFSLLSWICRLSGLSVVEYFFICALFYLLPLVVASRKIDRKYSFIYFLFIVVSLSFFNYGVNGVRNGIATSFAILAFSFDKKYKQYLLLLIALSFHISILILIVSYFLSVYIKSIKHCLIFWSLSIPLSFVLYRPLENILGAISFLEERTKYYLSGDIDLSLFSHSGFRFDFILYSSLPIIIYLLLIKKASQIDFLYNKYFKIYLLSNAFWILINQMPYSNRTAYLSWSIMPILLAYPLLKHPINKRYRFMFLSVFLFGYYMFTYLIN